MIHVGIDPGADGAIVALFPVGPPIGHRMPVVEVTGRRRLDIGAARRMLLALRDHDDLVVAIEAPSVRPGEGAVGALGIGLHHGAWHGLLGAMEIRHRIVVARTWRDGLGLPKSPGDPKQRKADAILACERLLPGLDLAPKPLRKPHDGIADAALIALWARGQTW